MANDYVLTIVVGTGFPGHAYIQIRGPETTIYTGFGPQERGIAALTGTAGRYDLVELPNGVSPVGAPTNPWRAFHYVDASKFSVKSFSFSISSEQVAAALSAAENYAVSNPNYALLGE